MRGRYEPYSRFRFSLFLNAVFPVVLLPVVLLPVVLLPVVLLPVVLLPVVLLPVVFDFSGSFALGSCICDSSIARFFTSGSSIFRSA